MKPTVLFAKNPVLFSINQNMFSPKGVVETAGANPVNKLEINSPNVSQGAFKVLKKKKRGKTKVIEHISVRPAVVVKKKYKL